MQFKLPTSSDHIRWTWQENTLLMPATKPVQPKHKRARWLILTALNLLLWIVSLPLIWHFLAR